MTLNQLIAIFESIAESHGQIFSFHAGENRNSLNEVQEYPLLFVRPEPWTVGEFNIQYPFTVEVLTKTESDKTDLVTIFSDTDQIIRDVMNMLEEYFDLDLEFGGVVTPVHNANSDLTAGVQTIISINAGKSKSCPPLKC